MKHLPELDGTIVANYQFHMEKVLVECQNGDSHYQIRAELKFDVGSREFEFLLLAIPGYDSLDALTQSEGEYVNFKVELLLYRLELVLPGFIQKDKLVQSFKDVYYGEPFISKT